jgi:hypothetical protein
MTEIRAQHCTLSPELHLCRSEDEVRERGVSVVIPQRMAASALDEGGWASMEVVPGGGWKLRAKADFAPECAEVHIHGLFRGDARVVEVTDTGGLLAWEPVPREN